jgi:phosphoglycolate phosphatase
LKIRAVLFDLDGTLLDTIEDLTDSMNAVLLTLGFPGHSVSDCKTLVGEGVEHFARGALPAGPIDRADAVGIQGPLASKDEAL